MSYTFTVSCSNTAPLLTPRRCRTQKETIRLKSFNALRSVLECSTTHLHWVTGSRATEAGSCKLKYKHIPALSVRQKPSKITSEC